MTDINEDHNHSDTELSQKAKDLVLHGDNTGHLHNSSTVPTRKNLNRKFKKGVYDHDKANVLWGYHADKAAQSYTREHGQPGDLWHKVFPPKDRRAAAAHWADKHFDAMQTGDQSHVHEDDTAAEIVYAAMEKSAITAHSKFNDALIERSKEIVDDKKAELAGKFMGGNNG
jgi:hypothetical protein